MREFFWWIFGSFFPWKKQEQKIHPKSTAKLKSEFGRFYSQNPHCKNLALTNWHLPDFRFRALYRVCRVTTQEMRHVLGPSSGSKPNGGSCNSMLVLETGGILFSRALFRRRELTEPHSVSSAKNSVSSLFGTVCNGAGPVFVTDSAEWPKFRLLNQDFGKIFVAFFFSQEKQQRQSSLNFLQSGHQIFFKI